MLSPLRCLALSAAVFTGIAGSVTPAVAATAYDANKGWTYLGGMAYGFLGDDKRNADNGWGSRLMVGARLPGGFRIEASAYGQQGKRDFGKGEDSTLGFGGDLLVPLTSGGNSPFLLFGGGYAKEDVSGKENGSAYANIGVGGMLPLSDFLTLRVETRYVEIFDDFANTKDGSPLYDFQIGLGLQVELGRPGRKRIVDRDRDGVAD